MADDTYDGWTNYETWSVNLERFDGLSLKDIGLVLDLRNDPGDIRDYLKDMVENDIDQVADDHFKCILYQFMREVNWAEIAEHIIDNSNNG